MSTPKTNAMRILDDAKIAYSVHTYESDGAIDGVSVAAKIGKPVETVYKTLVTQGQSRSYYVFVIPVAAELKSQSGRKGGGREIGRNDRGRRHQQGDGLRARRLFPAGV